jgi:hypothetical protein
MELDTQYAPASKKMLWAGRIVSALPVLFMAGGGIVTLIKPATMEEGLAHLGYPQHLGRGILFVEIACAIIYAIPQTAVLGAILLTGYLGGATASHVRVGEPQWLFPVIMGVVVWLGLYLREPRLRAFIPRRG